MKIRDGALLLNEKEYCLTIDLIKTLTVLWLIDGIQAIRSIQMYDPERYGWLVRNEVNHGTGK